MKLKHVIISVIIFIIIISSTLLYSRFVATKGLTIKEKNVINNSIPDSFHGVKIIHFSDLHYGTTVNEKDLEKIVNKINETKPDIVIFTGDLIDSSIKINEKVSKIIKKHFKNINSTLGNYFILGEDDKNNYYVNIMEESTFINIDKSFDTIYNGTNENISIYGINYKFDENEELKSNYNIVALHNPKDLDNINHKFNLAIAGHTHGGQVVIPLIKKSDTYIKKNKTEMYISTGIGTKDYYFRLFNKPSINLYRLRTK